MCSSGPACLSPAEYASLKAEQKSKQAKATGTTKVVLIAGMRKPYLTVFDDGDYAAVASLAREFASSTPRHIAT